jgi:two-component system, OmpR family, osmolarity sensor histidine kinase EnvZ
MAMSLSRTEAGASGWRTLHLLLASLLGFLLVLTTVTLLLLRYSAMQPSVRQLALPLATLADLVDASDAGSSELAQRALSRQGVVRAVRAPPAGVLVPVPFLNALTLYLHEQTGRQVQIERTADGATRLWLSSARGDWIGVPLEPLRSLVAQFAVLIVLFALALAVLAAWWLARRLAAPLERLARVAARLPEPVAADEFRVSGPREVRLLGERLAEALGRIDKHRRERDLLLAGLSHDLRTPLMRLLLRIDLLDSIPEDERAALGADIAELDRRIDRFIEHARTGAEEPVVALDLLPLLQAEVATSRQRGFGWSCVPGVRMRVRGQPGVLGRLIANLIDNAEQHGAAPFAAELQLDPQSSAICLLKVRNGLPASAERSATGGAATHRGFGLALCRHIAQAHGGSLASGQDEYEHWVELRLPLIQANPGSPDQSGNNR